MKWPELIVSGVTRLSLVVASVCLVAMLVQIVRARDLATRVVALNMAGLAVVSAVTAHAIHVDEPVYLDTVLVLSLLAVLSTITIARYMERCERKPEP